jgi:CO/xanthine dehydrogenase Mo-binding subunit
MADYAVIGKAGLLDKQGPEIVTGQIEAPDDVYLGQRLFARILECPHAKAKVKSIDVSQAMALAGVVATVDHTEVPGWVAEKYFVGAPVVAVAAVDEDTCYQAMKLIKVEYEILNGVISPDDAMQANAPLVGLWPDNNMHVRVDLTRGKGGDAGLANADVSVNEAISWSTPHQTAPIEGGNCTAWWIGDHLYAWVSTQNPHGEHSGFAGSFQIKHNQVSVYSHGQGGGFGGGRAAVQLPAAALAKKTGKVVALHSDRTWQFKNGARQFKTRAQIAIGAKKDGTITGIKAEYWTDSGTNPGTPCNDSHQPLATTFKCPDASFKINGIITNTQPTGYYRCVSHPGGAWCMNVALTKLAEKLGMDPLEFRLKNLTTQADKDGLTGNPNSFHTIKQTFETCAEKIGYAAKKHAPNTKTLPDGRKHGIAITGHLDGHGGYSPGRAAIITLRPDGTCYINAGISRAGCGTVNAHCHFVAETLGLKYEDVAAGDYGNSAVTANGGQQAGSSNTTCTGAAFVMAARDARVQVMETAATLFTPPVKPEDLDARDSKIFLKADPTKSITYAAVGAKNGTIIGRGVGWPATLQRKVLDWPIGTACTQRPACAAAAEVAVDTETGEIEILNYAAVTDIGRIIFNQGMYAQGEAGVDHMIAQGLYWDFVIDPATGAMLNPCFLNHRFPGALDLPLDKYSVTILEGDSAVGPYGATGAGEPVSSNYACISQAVYNAIGAWIPDSPMHPWKILKALGKA